MKSVITPTTFYFLAGFLLLTTNIDLSNARVSKSFVRGFLVGYAKGLEEGKNLVHLQPVV